MQPQRADQAAKGAVLVEALCVVFARVGSSYSIRIKVLSMVNGSIRCKRQLNLTLPSRDENLVWGFTFFGFQSGVPGLCRWKC